MTTSRIVTEAQRTRAAWFAGIARRAGLRVATRTTDYGQLSLVIQTVDAGPCDYLQVVIGQGANGGGRTRVTALRSYGVSTKPRTLRVRSLGYDIAQMGRDAARRVERSSVSA